MVRMFQDFIVESNGPRLHYMALDWDDNILNMPTKIHMDKKVGDDWEPIDVSTSEFAKIRNDSDNWRVRNNNPREAFSEFRDYGVRGDEAFLEDAKKAISSNNFGPSWNAFVRCLEEGWIFAIITARGHEPESMKKVMCYIIDHVLTEDQQFSLYNNCLKHAYIFKTQKSYDRIPKGVLSQTELIKDYINLCDFYGITSEAFTEEFGEGSASHPEKSKGQALDKFIEKCKKFGEFSGQRVSVGFSDDDPKNIEHVHTYFKEKSALSNNLKLSLYKTTDPTKIGGEKTKYHSVALEGNQSVNFDGLQSRVMPFTKWNNMSQTLFQGSKDRPMDPYHNQMKNQVGSVIDMTKEFAYKRRKKKNRSI